MTADVEQHPEIQARMDAGTTITTAPAQARRAHRRARTSCRLLAPPVVLAALIGASLGACTSDSEPAPGPTPTPTIAPARSIGPLVPAYCDIQGLRELIASGDISVSDLPTSVGGTKVDLTQVGGTPLIVDFTKAPPPALDRFRDQLHASPGPKDVTIDRDRVVECLRTTTDADIERTQGGPGYLTGQ